LPTLSEAGPARSQGGDWISPQGEAGNRHGFGFLNLRRDSADNPSARCFSGVGRLGKLKPNEGGPPAASVSGGVGEALDLRVTA